MLRVRVCCTYDEIRPSSDRLRQTLFDILVHGYGDAVTGARVLDLFAGTGALGLEALSRGATYAVFVDTGVESRALLRQNIEAFGLTGRSKVFRRDATMLGDPGTMAPFHLVFADPPYGQGKGEAALAEARRGGWLARGALLVLEERAGNMIGEIPGLSRVDRREVGDSQLVLLRATGDD